MLLTFAQFVYGLAVVLGVVLVVHWVRLAREAPRTWRAQMGSQVAVWVVLITLYLAIFLLSSRF